MGLAAIASCATASTNNVAATSARDTFRPSATRGDGEATRGRHVFYCPGKFSWEHMKHCSMRSIYLIEVDSELDNDPDATDDNVKISLSALTGITTPMTMHLGLTLQEHVIRALVDSGSTHCFIASDTACRLRPEPRPHHVSCEGLYSALPVQINVEHLDVDFYTTCLQGTSRSSGVSG